MVTSFASERESEREGRRRVQDADLREDIDGEDHHARGREQ